MEVERSIQLKLEIKAFKSKLFSRYDECKRMMNRLQKKYDKWLEGKVISDKLKKELLGYKKNDEKSFKKAGRPSSNFLNITDRSKRRRSRLNMFINSKGIFTYSIVKINNTYALIY